MSFYKNRYFFKTKNLFSNSRLNYMSIVLLFGSRALGTNHDKSDYDFVVYTNQKLNNLGEIVQNFGMILVLFYYYTNVIMI